MKKNNCQKLVVAVNPFRLNERLACQRAVFLCPSDISTEFMNNLSAFGDSDQVRRLINKAGQNGDIRDKALKQLDLMNINRIPLFPGLDCFAQSFAPGIRPLFMQQAGII